jgi:hypothetical protein
MNIDQVMPVGIVDRIRGKSLVMELQETTLSTVSFVAVIGMVHPLQVYLPCF